MKADLIHLEKILRLHCTPNYGWNHLCKWLVVHSTHRRFWKFTGLFLKRIKSVSLLFSPVSLSGFPGGSAGKEFACNEGDLGSLTHMNR